MIKDTNEQTGDEVHGARAGRVPSTEACPMELGNMCGCVHLPGSSLNLALLGFHEGFIAKGGWTIKSVFSSSLFSREWANRERD